MNQFTKQELLMLKEWGMYCDYIPKQLIHKIDLMVINYCEHEFQEHLYSMDMCLCIKCGMKIHYAELEKRQISVK